MSDDKLLQLLQAEIEYLTERHADLVARGVLLELSLDTLRRLVKRIQEGEVDPDELDLLRTVLKAKAKKRKQEMH